MSDISVNTEKTTMILAGDIGGTKTNLALVEARADGSLRETASATFTSAAHAGLEEVVAEFLAGQSARVELAAFGIAGPIVAGECRTPNLPWVVSETKLRAALDVERIFLLNDLEATGYGVSLLPADQLVTLNQGQTEGGNKAVIAAGTGLGEAGLFWDGRQYRVVASEGGHVDFAPRNELEIGLLRYWLARKRRVSYERVLSGPGLVGIYDYLKQLGNEAEPASLAEELAVSTDKARTISGHGIAETSALCTQALDVFVSIYGAGAGNLALKFKSTGGIYLGGGIAPKIIAKLTDGTFMRAFCDKGRLTPLVQAVPVHVVMNPRTALLGAAHFAANRNSLA